MESLEDLIKTRLSHHNLSVSAKSAEVVYFANQLLANELESQEGNVKAFKFNGGILYVSVKNASLGQEVWGVQESVLQGLQKRFGEKVIKKIRIKSLTIN